MLSGHNLMMSSCLLRTDWLLWQLVVEGASGDISTRSGQYTINPQFDDAWPFSEGLAHVKIRGKWGFIDKSGEYVINPQFEDAKSFEDGLACVKIDGKWGGINKVGEYVINPQFDFISVVFSEGLAWVKIGGKYGYISESSFRK